MANVELAFKTIQDGRPETLGILTLNRPELSNAFNGEMITEITTHLKTIHKKWPHCRALLLKAAGKNFSAGGDLKWMKASIHLTYKQNLKDANSLAQMYEALYRLPMPTVAMVQGASYGGALGLIAACDIALAVDNSKFCLSEVKWGILPAVVLPYLMTKMAPGALRRFALEARVFSAAEAMQAGLIQRIISESETGTAFVDELNLILAGAPQAQRTFKEAHQKQVEGSKANWNARLKTMAATIAKARAGKEGQKGLSAFLNKALPEWALSVTDVS